MPARTVVEWQCKRCGNEEAVEQGRAHGWRLVVGLHGYKGNPEPKAPEPHASGDVCPQCAASYLAWWLDLSR